MKLADSQESELFASGFLLFKPFKINVNCLNRLSDLFEYNRKSFKEIESNEFTTLSEISDDSTEKSSVFSRLSDFINKTYLFSNNSRSTLNESEFYQHELNLINKLNASKNEAEAIQILAKMWKHVIFCDLILISNGREFLAHKVALAFYSEKYRSYFHQNKLDFVSRIQLSESSPKSIFYILNYIYTNEITVNLKTIEDVIVCAQELDLKKLVQMCESCLMQLGKKYVLQVLQIARRRKLKVPYFRSFWFTVSNFDECIKLNYFTKLSPGLLLELLSNRPSSSRNETNLFKRILLWIYLNKDKYSNRSIDFLKEIDMSKIDIVDFDLILSENSFILQIPGCLQFFKNSIKMHYDEKKKTGTIKTRSRSLMTPRINREANGLNDEIKKEKTLFKK